MPVVCVSGGFDPVHVGHVRLIEAAHRMGSVVVILNSDAWLMRKKSYVFMPWEERKEILESMTHVMAVKAVDDSDGTVFKALAEIRPDYFANGGDRTAENTPEIVWCIDHGITPLFGIGGGKVAGSQEIVKRALRAEYV